MSELLLPGNKYGPLEIASKQFDPQAELRQAIALKARLLEQKERLIREHKINFFAPNSPKQVEFFEHCLKRRRGIFAGNRFGKSTLGVCEDISWALGYRPWYPKGHELRTKGIPQASGIRGIVIAQDWDRVRELFTDDQSRDKPGKFFEWAPKGSVVKSHRRQNGVIDQLYFQSTTDDGRVRESSIFFDTVKSFKADGLSQESLDWDFIHLDEPVPEALYTALSRGLIDRGGFMWMLLTPLREIWMYNFMVQGMKDEPENFWFASAEMTDNPELNPDEIRLFLANLSEAERNCRARGIPLAYGNLVYDKFNPDVHVLKDKPKGWPDRFTPPTSWQVLISIDTHAKTPHAVLFAAIGPEHVIIFREIWKHCLISELCQDIKNAIQGLRVEAIICDPIAWIENPETGRAWIDTFEEYGLEVSKASKQKEVGIQETNCIWVPEYHKKVLVLDNCRHFLREIANYFYDKDDKPVDKDDHFMECLYRMTMHDHFTYIPETTFSSTGGLHYDDRSVDFLENSEAIMQL